jgi:hypothetical protein
VSRRGARGPAGSEAQRGRGPVALPVPGKKGERRKDRLRFLEGDVDLPAVAAVPSEGGAVEALRLFISKQEAKLEGFGTPDVSDGLDELVSAEFVQRRLSTLNFSGGL